MVTKEWGERTRETIFPETPIVRVKNVWKKIVAKNCEKNVFYIHTSILTNKWWKKRAKQYFQKHTNGANKKCCK